MFAVRSEEPPRTSRSATPADRAASPAAASIAGSGSIAVTAKPSLANGTASIPVPVPRSSTASPGANPARSATRATSRAG